MGLAGVLGCNLVTSPAPPAQTWLLLLYKVARQPSARRVSIWRKLKRLGALLLHDAVWVLPDTTRTREQFQWLAAEIGEQGGAAVFWQAQVVQGLSEAALVEKFSEQTAADYRAILKALKAKRPNLAALALQYQQARQHDYFPAPLGAQVEAALRAARGDIPP